VGFEFWQFVCTQSVLGLVWAPLVFTLVRRVILPRRIVSFFRARDRLAKLGPLRPAHTRRSPQPYPSRRAVRVFAGVMVAYLTWWNAANLGWVSMSPAAKQLAFTFKIDQYWRLFAPSPCQYPEWPAIFAELHNGTRVDMWAMLFNPSAASYAWAESKPALASESYRNYRWKRYFGNIWAVSAAACR
jgi:hypothetical protein